MSERPQKKIGTLPICWLEYNARSLNGRIYPKATCDAIFRAAQAVLSDPNAMPPTTFVSHEAANGNVNTDLIGAPVKVWQEGSKFWAHIDIADTSVARDILGLLEGKYLRSGSMRVGGVELRHDNGYDLPLVIIPEGITPQFLGIDLTTRPGLDKIARVSQVLYESNGQEVYNDAFMFESLSFESREEPPAMIPIYAQILLGMTQEAFPSKSQEAHSRVHDHLASVLEQAIGECHGQESARLKGLTEAQLDEAGKAIAMKHAVRLAAAHDEAAKSCAMECAGCYDAMLGIDPGPDDGGDDTTLVADLDHDGESQTTPPAMQEGEKPMTPEEMLAALKAQGYQIEAPKSAAEELADLKRIVAEQSAQIKTLVESAPSQRQTIQESQFEESSVFQPEELYQEGDLMRGDLAPKNWKALADRRVPWPHDKIDVQRALHEMTPFLAHRLNAQEAAAHGRDISAYIKQDELI